MGLPEFETSKFDVIFAAVPCTEYSMALTTRPRDLPLADAVEHPIGAGQSGSASKN